jgi:hypothetical protein
MNSMPTNAARQVDAPSVESTIQQETQEDEKVIRGSLTIDQKSMEPPENSKKYGENSQLVRQPFFHFKRRWWQKITGDRRKDTFCLIEPVDTFEMNQELTQAP